MGQDIEDETMPDIPVHTFRDSSTGSYENDMRGRGASGGSVVIILALKPKLRVSVADSNGTLDRVQF